MSSNKTKELYPGDDGYEEAYKKMQLKQIFCAGLAFTIVVVLSALAIYLHYIYPL